MPCCPTYVTQGRKTIKCYEGFKVTVTGIMHFFMKNCLNLIFILSFRKEDEVEPRQSRPEHFLGVGYSEIGVMETVFLFNFSVFTRGCLLNFKMVTYVLGETP